MRKLVPFLAAVVLLCSFSPSPYGQTENDVKGTAQKDLQSMLSQIPAGQLEGFGFNSRSEFATSSIGKPYRMLGLNMDIYKGLPVDNEHAIVAQDKWRVPVMVNGQQRLLLNVNAKSGAYMTVGMGASMLASELQKKSALSNSANQYCLLRIFPLEADFFVEANGTSFANAKFYPLYSATMSMPMLNETGSRSFTLNEILPIIKDALKNQQKH